MSERLRLRESRVMFWLCAVLLLATASPAGSQLVRGTVREATSAAPLAGVVVTIVRTGAASRTGMASGTTPLAALTNARGEYVISAGTAGEVFVTAKRIGVRQFESPRFTLGAGETRVLDIVLEGVRYELPLVTVSAATPCGEREGERGRIASLWAEASAALTASELSTRDRLVRATITRYQQELDPGTLAVRREAHEVRHGAGERAFVSVSAESLAAVGYARVLRDGMIEFFAPDERVLLSDTFVRGHCFGLAPVSANGEVGITFAPVRSRRQSDIEGTIWLDARSYELRRVDFRYTNFPLPVSDRRTGGEVQFSRLASGAWLVSRWRMRVPRVVLRRDLSGTPRLPRVETERPEIAAFTEHGGYVEADELSAVRRATLNGRVLDSTGRGAITGGRVSLRGTSREGRTGHDGAFRIDSIPAGTYTLVAEHPAYARLGLVVAEQSLEIAEGGTSVTVLQAIGTEQILRQLCGYDQVPAINSALRIVVAARATPETQPPQPAMTTLHLTWVTLKELTPNVVRTLATSTDLPLDAAGGVTACALPRDVRLEVEERSADGTVGRRWQVVTPPFGFAVTELR